MHRLYVTAPAGTADLAAEELAACGVVALKVERGGVAFEGTLEQAYRACLWSRVANRVLLAVAEFPAATPEALYDGVRAVDWSEHLGVDGTLAVACTSGRSAITHTQFASLKVKDAVVDQFRERTGSAAVGRRRRARRTLEPAPRPRHRDAGHRSRRRQLASSRLSRRAGRGAPQGESGRRDVAAFGLGEARGRRRRRARIRRSDVRRGQPGDRGRVDRGRRRARTAAQRLRFPPLAGS